MNVLALLEADSISGTAKSVLELGTEAGRPESVSGLRLSVARFHRGGAEENVLTRELERVGLRLDTILESGRFDRAVIPRLQQLVRTGKPDVVWTNSVKSHFLTRAAGLNRMAAWTAFHHGYTTTDFKMQLYNQADRWSLRAADRVLTTCGPFAKMLEGHGVPREKIHIQHMPARRLPEVPAAERLALRERLGAGEGAKIVLSVGRFSKEKGHLDLLNVFAELRRQRSAIPLKLVLVGEGPERPRIEAAARELRIWDDVIFTGQQKDVQAYYAAADLYLLTSLSEGSPNVLLEAMSAGTPVVATAVGGVPEMVSDGVDALLAPRGDRAALAAAALRILDDTELRDKIVEAGRSVLTRYAPRKYLESMVSTFAEAIGEARRRGVVVPA